MGHDPGMGGDPQELVDNLPGQVPGGSLPAPGYNQFAATGKFRGSTISRIDQILVLTTNIRMIPSGRTAPPGWRCSPSARPQRKEGPAASFWISAAGAVGAGHSPLIR